MVDILVTVCVLEAARRHGLELSRSGLHRHVPHRLPPLGLGLNEVNRMAHGLEQEFREL